MSKYDPFPQDITEEALMAKLDDQDSGIRMMALLHSRATLDIWLRALDDAAFFMRDLAAAQIRRHVRMLSDAVKAEPWTFYGKRNGKLIFRRGDDRIDLTPDELRLAIVDKFFERPTKAGITAFYVDVLAAMAK